MGIGRIPTLDGYVLRGMVINEYDFEFECGFKIPLAHLGAIGLRHLHTNDKVSFTASNIIVQKSTLKETKK
jgi:hypothetical protein